MGLNSVGKCLPSIVQGPGFNSPALLNQKKKKKGEEDKWRQRHLLHLIVEGLKRTKVKPLNYSQVTVVEVPEENPYLSTAS
jgi:hypothetical protein